MICASTKTSSIDKVRFSDNYSFDECSINNRQDWWLEFEFHGSSTIMFRSPRGLSAAIMINTFRPERADFFQDLQRILKSIDNDSVTRLAMKGR